MKINRSVLMEAMRKCLPGVEKSAGLIEGADTFVFHEGAVHTYNDSISVSVAVPALAGLAGAVKAMDLFKLITKMPGEELEVEMADQKWLISSGRSKAEVSLLTSGIGSYLAALNLPTIAWKKLPADFMTAMKLCKMGCNPTPVRGIFCQGTRMASTDSVRVNHYNFGEEVDTFWIDDPAAGELIKLGNLVEYAVTEAWVHWRGADGVVFSCKKKNPAQFPINGVVGLLARYEKKGDEVVGKLPKGLSEAVDRVAIFGQEQKGSVTIRMTLRMVDLVLSSERLTGRMEDSLAWETPFAEDPGLEVWVDAPFLVEAGRKVQDFFLSKNGGQTALIFHTDKYTQIAATKAAPRA